MTARGPLGPPYEVCKDCGAPVIWATVKDGTNRRALFNPEALTDDQRVGERSLYRPAVYRLMTDTKRTRHVRAYPLAWSAHGLVRTMHTCPPRGGHAA